MPESGQMLSYYRLVQKIGEGGMGVVWKAVDTKLDREVAIKLLPEELAGDPERVRRFEREAKAAAALNHPNIVTLHSVEETKGTTFITMELVEGDTLARVIPDDGLPLERFLDLALPLTEAIAAAHERGVTHRDLKPSNIMVTDDGRVKVLDFGLAKLRERVGADRPLEDSTKTLTRDGIVLGTMPYMSPEQLEGKPLDQRSDIFALGIVLYEMATGRRPFGGDIPVRLASSILRDVPLSLTEVNRAMPADLARIVRHCLQKDPDRRYQTAKGLRNELEELQAELRSGSAAAADEVVSRSPSIAVLPFTDMSPRKDQEYFCDGMVEELTDALAKLGDLRVASRTSAFQYKETTRDVREIGRRLGVRTVLEGSVRKAGNRLRVTAQLVNVTDGYHLWSDKYDRDLEDIFAVQDEISLAIVERLKVRLLGGEKEGLVKRFTQNQEAYSLYLKGRYLWNRRYEVGMRKSLDYFQQAIEQDPAYALPYVGMADSYAVLGFYGFLGPHEAFGRAKAAARRALQIDDSVGEAHAALAWCHFCYDWDRSAAERAFRKAIDLAPNYAPARHWYAVLLFATARFDEAIAMALQARELEPFSLIVNGTLGVAYMFSRQYDRAASQFTKTLDMDPEFYLARVWLGLTHVLAGRDEDARVTLNRATETEADNPYALANLGWGLGMTGQEEAATRILNKLEQLGGERCVRPYYKAMILWALGRRDEGFELFEAALHAREPQLTMWKTLPSLDALRSDPRYESILRRIVPARPRPQDGSRPDR
jgi:serine/threonine protein kinase/tetratricopeptide (TPR) repeat protein